MQKMGKRDMSTELRSQVLNLTKEVKINDDFFPAPVRFGHGPALDKLGVEPHVA